MAYAPQAQRNETVVVVNVWNMRPCGLRQWGHCRVPQNQIITTKYSFDTLSRFSKKKIVILIELQIVYSQLWRHFVMHACRAGATYTVVASAPTERTKRICFTRHMRMRMEDRITVTVPRPIQPPMQPCDVTPQSFWWHFQILESTPAQPSFVAETYAWTHCALLFAATSPWPCEWSFLGAKRR